MASLFGRACQNLSQAADVLTHVPQLVKLCCHSQKGFAADYFFWKIRKITQYRCAKSLIIFPAYSYNTSFRDSPSRLLVLISTPGCALSRNSLRCSLVPRSSHFSMFRHCIFSSFVVSAIGTARGLTARRRHEIAARSLRVDRSPRGCKTEACSILKPSAQHDVLGFLV